jgi:OOP family OmpA-OmpF porin
VADGAAVASNPPPDAGSGGAQFAELRTLLIGPEQRQLRALQTRLDDPAAHARDISRVLPAAVELRAGDPHLKRVLAPTIEEAISASVRRNPRPLADALFPIIGPAIRKAVAATLSSMLESLNATLETSLSWRSVRWRLDARRTGRPFAEIVLLNTLVYRVEQVFLIHRPSGLLLQHLTAPGTTPQDADMVSAMLTAIRDFVQDSFRVDDEEGLQTLKVGDLSVWIEQGPHALLAAVIRGTAPPDVRTVLQQTLESVHGVYSDVLESYGGDPAALEGTRPLLEACLQQQFRGRSRPAYRSPLLQAAAALLLAASAFWVLTTYRERARWSGYLAALRAEPGLVVVGTGKENGRRVVEGLRDPLARDPASLLAPHGLGSGNVVGRWELYQALDPPIVLARARRQLRPPEGVSLELRDGVLQAGGRAPVEWIEESARVAPILAGVARFDATGAIEASLRALAGEIERDAPLFLKGSTEFAAGGEQIVREQAARLQSLDRLAAVGGRRFQLQLVGEADADGPPDANLPLSQARARRVLGMLEPNAFSRVSLAATGVGSRHATDPAAAEDAKQGNRRVSFRVIGSGEAR